MNEQLVTGLVVALGALAYNLWGFWNAWQKTIATPALEVWDWRLTVTAIVPSLVAGFFAGYAMNTSGLVDYVALLSSGFGIASAQKKLGVDNFFRS